MIRKLIYPLIALSLFGMTACSGSDDSGDPQPDPDPDPMTVTYNNTVSGIISSNCTTCHGNPPTNGAPISLLTYSQVVDAINNKSLIDRINGVSGIAQMPPTGLMNTTTRQIIEDWVADGMPEK